MNSKHLYRNRVKKFKNDFVILEKCWLGMDVLNQNSLWSIGNGLMIDFRYDDWLSIGPIRNWIQGPLGSEDSARKVHSIVHLGN